MKKTFIFSRRFLILLFLAWATHLIYASWELHNLYKDDFKGKGLPSLLLLKWLWYQMSGVMLSLSFLLALLLAMTFYSHYQMKKHRESFQLFSPVNWIVIFVLAMAGFIYISFREPVNIQRSRQMLSAIVYSRSYNDFKAEMKRPFDGFKDAKMMTLPELVRKKHSLNNQRQENKPEDLIYGNDAYQLKKVKWEIAKKYALPLSIILFYILGVFMGISFYKVHSIVPLLISYFLVFGGWYYCHRLFEHWSKNDKINIFLGASGPELLLCILLTCWWLGLRKYGLFKKHQVEFLPEFSEAANSDIGDKNL